MTLKDLKVGQEITLVSKGIHHGYGSDWIDESRVGRTSFLKVTRVGKKYVYGNFIYFGEEGKEIRDWETDLNAEEYVIFPTIRRDLEEKNRQFRKAVDDYEKLQGKFEYELDRKHYEMKRKETDEWRALNPRPTQKIEDYR